jgi:hypothetical protein
MIATGPTDRVDTLFVNARVLFGVINRAHDILDD